MYNPVHIKVEVVEFLAVWVGVGSIDGLRGRVRRGVEECILNAWSWVSGEVEMSESDVVGREAGM